MKIIHVVNTLRHDHGGPTYSVSHLAKSLLNLPDIEVELQLLGESSLSPQFPVPITSYEHSRYGMWQGRKGLVASSQVFHSHGLWRFPNLAAARLSAKSKCRHVISPRGMLARDSLKQKSIRKRIGFYTWQKKALAGAAVLHATSEMEIYDIRSQGLKTPIALIPNGIDIPTSPKPQVSTTPHRILFMGRMAPLKRIDELIKAWARVGPERADWEVHIVGSGDDYRGKLKALSQNLQAPRVFFHDAVVENERDEWYRRSDLLVLPSARAENFGLVVAEALSHGTPVIASTATPWKSLQEKNCGWWVDCEAHSLEKTLREVTAMPPNTLYEMGKAGRSWVTEQFGWDRVSKMMHETYRWILGETNRPEWVHL